MNKQGFCMRLLGLSFALFVLIPSSWVAAQEKIDCKQAISEMKLEQSNLEVIVKHLQSYDYKVTQHEDASVFSNFSKILTSIHLKESPADQFKMKMDDALKTKSSDSIMVKNIIKTNCKENDAVGISGAYSDNIGKLIAAKNQAKKSKVELIRFLEENQENIYGVPVKAVAAGLNPNHVTVRSLIRGANAAADSAASHISAK